MNANSNETGSADLSLQPQEISLQARVVTCPKCQHQRTAADHGPDWQCPGCGVAYNKAAPSAVVTHIVNTAPVARGRLEIDRDDRAETTPPSAIAFSLTGRIGRLRYLAFSWPTIVLSGLLGAMFALTSRHEGFRTILLVVVGVLWMWMPLRLMALRMHDLNRSSKWLLALMLLPGVCFAAHKPQMGLIFSGLFWLVALLLILLPGSESDNEYGPPPGPNTTWVTVGAALFLALMALGVVGNIKLMRSGKLHPTLWNAPGTDPGQPAQNGSTGSLH